ncbi:hypothetical protein E2562_023723 [Oryza meyeriana var. granulata]|uniref:Uncharacterized protein n=1 Tax=Oryza meyeriana var. granulata TaxID=110450 RepID=A0A6G1DPJ9_9ORYZ|nr:hypothetical protein E2562_023723 [Oryza meyeriana var. granulata]
MARWAVRLFLWMVVFLYLLSEFLLYALFFGEDAPLLCVSAEDDGCAICREKTAYHQCCGEAYHPRLLRRRLERGPGDEDLLGMLRECVGLRGSPPMVTLLCCAAVSTPLCTAPAAAALMFSIKENMDH